MESVRAPVRLKSSGQYSERMYNEWKKKVTASMIHDAEFRARLSRWHVSVFNPKSSAEGTTARTYTKQLCIPLEARLMCLSMKYIQCLNPTPNVPNAIPERKVRAGTHLTQ